MNVVITGVTRGLGRAWADGFCERGLTVAGCGRTASAIRDLQARFKSPHQFAVVDVADDESVSGWASAVLEAIGPPDILINNAAVINRPQKLWSISATEFDQVIDINVKGVANVIRHFVPAMVARRRGVIVNLSSGWGRTTAPDVAPYCASKYAIEGLTKALAQELPTGMAAIPLNPGVIDTDMLRAVWSGEAGNYITPKEWSRLAVDYVLRLGPADNGQSRSISLG